MKPSARHALEVIRECIEQDRFILSVHITERMDERGLFWPDLLAVIESPADVRSDGPDEFGRPKWILAGNAADGLDVELVCAFDQDDQDSVTVFITLYWD